MRSTPIRPRTPRPPIATWWRIAGQRAEITPIDVVAFSPKSATVRVKGWNLGGTVRQFREKRELRKDIFPTFGEAKGELISRSQKRVDYLKDQLERAKAFLSQVEKLESWKTKG